jgi:hypothetical protein
MPPPPASFMPALTPPDGTTPPADARHFFLLHVTPSDFD